MTDTPQGPPECHDCQCNWTPEDRAECAATDPCDVYDERHGAPVCPMGEVQSPNPAARETYSAEIGDDGILRAEFSIELDGDAIAHAAEARAAAWIAEYERVLAELQALAAQHNMSAAIMMVEFGADGKPAIDDTGLRSIREMLAPLGYEVVKRSDP